MFPATPVTIVRKDPGTEDARRALATAFMKQHTALGGLSQHKLASHLKGIDFRKPVTIKTLPKGTCIVQYVRKNGQPGLYCAYPGTQPRDLAIWARGREVQEWTITKPTRVLESTASKMRHLPGTLIGGPGGDIQLLMPKTWLRHATPVQM